MKAILTLLTLFLCITVYADNACKKCDIEKVKMVQAHLDSLTFTIISDFLCTFGKSCINDAEFSASSNGTLFTVLEYAPTLFFRVLAKSKFDNDLLLKEVESPINDLIDLQKIYNKVKR